ncbi:hypothetical protein FRC04_001125 [Tulasnella sp. 424]|nr:hypothetical protein FRC04_001125 [Tulasnella sp. 424]KAG8969361.1 hypothetical protein FRC05_001100 [Tulasnella sp. 425]
MKLDDLKSTISAALDGIRECEELPKTPINHPDPTFLGLSFFADSPTQLLHNPSHIPGPYVQHTPDVPLPCLWIDEFGRLSDVLSLESFFLLKNLYPTPSDDQNVFIPAADFEFRNPAWKKHLQVAQENAVKHFATASEGGSSEYVCQIHGLLISRAGSDGDFRNFHGPQAVGLFAVTLPSSFRGGNLNFQQNSNPFTKPDISIQSDFVSTPQDDETFSPYLYNRTHNLDVESEYGSNQIAFIYPNNSQGSKYALTSITSIEKGFRLLLLYQIQFRPKTPIVYASGLTPTSRSSPLGSISPMILTRPPSPSAIDDCSAALQRQFQTWKQHPHSMPERFVYVLPDHTVLTFTEKWVERLCGVADVENITLNTATLVYRVVGRQDSIDSEDRTLWLPETEELTLEAIEALRSSRNTTPAGTPFLNSNNLLFPTSPSSSDSSGKMRSPRSVKLRLPGYGSPSRIRRAVMKTELLNIDNVDLMELRSESTPLEEHGVVDGRGATNGLVEQSKPTFLFHSAAISSNTKSF